MSSSSMKENMTEKDKSRFGISPASDLLWKNRKKRCKTLGMDHAEDSIWLSWKDLTVASLNRDKCSSNPILQGLAGYAQPRKMLAIMGPSGSGKSTLLSALAGRLAKNSVQRGEILVNGRYQKLSYGTAAYVDQDDILIGTLTLRETLCYSAHLRLPDKMSTKEKLEIVDRTIMEMGLHECKNTPIGTWHMRGISEGEKRRVSIAIEILTRPRLLFLDEPTSGLDSASAFFVTWTLRNLARQGRTVIASIHQPSSEVFALFEGLCLLSAGKLVYFGESRTCNEFFAEAGFPCPPLRNPCDHFIRCINSDFDRVKVNMISSLMLEDRDSIDVLDTVSAEESTRLLINHYQSSNHAMVTAAKVQESSEFRGPIRETGVSEASFFMQTFTLTKRSFLNMKRDLGYYRLRVFLYTGIAICLGTIFIGLGKKFDDIKDRANCLGYVFGFQTFLAIGGFPSFVEDMKVFRRERQNGHYGVTAFVIANTLSSQPFLMLISITSGPIAYYMARLNPRFDRFLFFELNLCCCMAVVESLMMAMAAVLPSYLMGIISGAGILGLFMLSSGYFRSLPNLPKPVWRYPMSYICFHSWSIQGQYKNEFLGMEFEPEHAGMPKITGPDAVRYCLGSYSHLSKWVDLCILLFMVFVYRTLFFLIVKYQEGLNFCSSKTSNAHVAKKKMSSETHTAGDMTPSSTWTEQPFESPGPSGVSSPSVVALMLG